VAGPVKIVLTFLLFLDDVAIDCAIGMEDKEFVEIGVYHFSIGAFKKKKDMGLKIKIKKEREKFLFTS
jgi:hypothetical protein